MESELYSAKDTQGVPPISQVSSVEPSCSGPKEKESHSEGKDRVLPGYLSEEEEIPDHFYDSDLASINEKDFLSDNEPPKDVIEERKLLKKQKMLHIFKTIIRLGYHLQKPARYDLVNLKWKEVPQEDVKPRPLNLNKKKREKEEREKEAKEEKEEEEEDKEKIQQQEEKKEAVESTRPEVPTQNTSENQKEQSQKESQLRQIEAYQQSHTTYEYPPYFSSSYLADTSSISYNLGKQYLQIEQLVTSMKRGEVAVFQLEHLELSKRSGIKRRVKVEVFVIWLDEWTTVIDVDCDGKFMKEVMRRGEGHSRVALHDEVAFKYSLSKGGIVAESAVFQEPVRVEPQFLKQRPNVLWRMMHSMKTKQAIRVYIADSVMVEVQKEKYQKLHQECQGKDESKDGVDTKQGEKWLLEVEVFWFHSLDDIFLDGRLLKKTLTRGVSTARPDPSSLVYYALQFHSPSGELLYSDPCFNSDWWEDLSKLDELKCRKNHLDDESVSDLLVKAIDRMKPAEVSILECRDPSLFSFGSDYEEYMKLAGVEEVPELVKLTVRVYNFTEGRNCFNMELPEKVEQARRKKKIALKYLSRGDIQKALSTFETIVSFFSSGKIDQQGYDEKISALMNSCFCQLKSQNFREVVKLSELILESPRHGYDPEKLKVKGPGHAKIEGKLPEEPDDERESAELTQSDKILDKCRWRKALSLVRMGEGQQALDCLSLIKVKDSDVLSLQKQAVKMKEQYQKKSAKMFKNMFG